MPVRTCPKCQALTPRLLEEVSKDAWVNYYRCPACGHFWTVPKPTPNDLREPDPPER